jgi:purine nucleosidase
MQVARDNPWVRQRCASKLLQPVRDFLDIYDKGRPEVVFHDPLAAACIFEPDLCGWRRGRVEVELTGSSRAIGMTHWTGDKPDVAAPGPHEIAATVEADRFVEHYFDVFK